MATLPLQMSGRTTQRCHDNLMLGEFLVHIVFAVEAGRYVDLSCCYEMIRKSRIKFEDTLITCVNCVALLIKNKMILVNKYTASVVCCRVSHSGSWAGRCVALECCPESCLIFWVITLTALITNGHFATDKILFFNRISSLHPLGFCLWKHTYYTVSDSCTA